MPIAVVQGTRPEIIKNYPIVRALAQRGIPFEVLHTGQHVRSDMCDDVYLDMGYRPDRVLPQPYRLGATIDWLQDQFRRDAVSSVIVNGDTAAALAGAIAAMYVDLPVAHIEAGLRSGDTDMLEERNRLIVDRVADQLFAYTTYEVGILRRAEGIRGSIHLEGNTTVDVLHDFGHRLVAPADPTPYVFVTMHRKEFTDWPDRMELVFRVLRDLAASTCRVVFPMHPRTADAVARYGLPAELLAGVEVVDPVTVFESLSFQRYAAAVLTDSGCVQEEAYLLDTPCVTIRDNTERHLTVLHGANIVTGFDAGSILRAAADAVGATTRAWPPIYGEPGVGARIVERIAEGGERYGSRAGAASACLGPPR